MKIRWYRFNIYLALALVAAAVCGCRTSPESKNKKLLSTLRLHLETNRDTTGFNEAVPIYREHPFMVTVEKMPFLNESNVTEARVVDVVGGYVLRIQFNHAGTQLLEQYSASNRGKRIAVFSQFGEKLSEVRWLAAPVIARRVSDGVFIFTPDASREEAEQIALGLNHVFKKAQTWIDK
jgi:preprotein translocase subunit SecD